MSLKIIYHEERTREVHKMGYDATTDRVLIEIRQWSLEGFATDTVMHTHVRIDGASIVDQKRVLNTNDVNKLLRIGIAEFELCVAEHPYFGEVRP